MTGRYTEWCPMAVIQQCHPHLVLRLLHERRNRWLQTGPQDRLEIKQTTAAKMLVAGPAANIRILLC